jgi:hypothetical protein
MKAQTQKIVLTKSGSVNKSVSNMISNCNFSTDKIYTGYYSGSGRFTTSHSAMGLVIQILSAQGYKFEKGNDAPKGGIKGEYLKISKTAINFIKSLK